MWSREKSISVSRSVKPRSPALRVDSLQFEWYQRSPVRNSHPMNKNLCSFVSGWFVPLPNLLHSPLLYTWGLFKKWSSPVLIIICYWIRLFFLIHCHDLGLPWRLSRWRNHLQCRRPGFDPWVRKIPLRRKWEPSPVFLPEKSHGQKSPVGYSPQGLKELGMTAHTHVILL